MLKLIFRILYYGYKNLYGLASLNHKTDKSGIEDILKKVGLYEAKDKLVKKYSLGILLVSHNFEDIKCLCDKIYEIDHGKLMLPAD